MRKKIVYIGLLQAFLLINVRLSLAQNSISKANETVIINASQQVVENYTRYLELLASESDAELLDVYKAELLKSVEKDSIYVYNDLIPPERRPAERDQNIDPLTTYFDDISSRYR